jgi:hypothetical protein
MKEPFRTLESDMIETFLAGHKEYRPDLPYPESYSDMCGGIRALLRRFDIKPRAIPLDRAELYPEPEPKR